MNKRTEKTSDLQKGWGKRSVTREALNLWIYLSYITSYHVEGVFTAAAGVGCAAPCGGSRVTSAHTHNAAAAVTAAGGGCDSPCNGSQFTLPMWRRNRD